MGNLARYGSFDIGEADKAAEQVKAGGSSDFMKMKVGRNVVRILPPALGQRTPFVTVHQHFIKLPTSAKPVVFACPRMHDNKPCPACAQADKFRKSGRSEDRSAMFELLPKMRLFANVIDRTDGAVKILGFGKTIYEQLIALRRDQDAGGDYTDPENGFDIIIERTGTGARDTEYRVMPARKQSPMGDLSILDTLPDLQRFAEVKPLADIEAMLRGEEPQRRDQGGRTYDAEALPAKPRGRSVEDDVYGDNNAGW